MIQRSMKILAALLLIVIVGTNALALEVVYRYRESRVETAFLFNFSKFVTWPETSFGDRNSPIIFAVFDAERYAAASESLTGRQIGGRALEVRKIVDIDEALNSHLLFIGAAEAPRLDKHLAAIAGRPILTVSDIEGFAARGGMVELFKRERKIRFGIQMAPVRKSGLNISSEVLRLASFVLSSNGGEKR